MCFETKNPGPGRFRQFMQFDADTVGTPTVTADAEMCMMAADCMEALGIPRGDYVIRVNNRKVLDGVMDTIGLGGDEHAGTRLAVLRAIDKLDRLGETGVQALLGAGRMDESGDYTKGAGLEASGIATVLGFVTARGETAAETASNLEKLIGSSEVGRQGVTELADMGSLFSAAGYDDGRILIDPSIVRGLEYYTGPVYEAELTFEVTNEDGDVVRFGSVAGGGRYDGLVGRFALKTCPRPASPLVFHGWLPLWRRWTGWKPDRKSALWLFWSWIGIKSHPIKAWSPSCATPAFERNSISVGPG